MDELERRRERKRLRATRPVGAFGPSARKQQVIGRVMAEVDAAEERHNPAAYYSGKTPTPGRITAALNIRGLYGPEVDEALGGEEPMVDEWESGARVPGLAEIRALAKLTDFPVRFFYLPEPPPISNGWICGTDGWAPLGGNTGRADA